MIFEKQEYQQNCVNSIVSILEKMENFSYSEFDKTDIKSALEQHYTENNYYTSDFPIIIRNGIDVLMETGTGKTFCYLKTIFELNKNFGKTRFIIIVPRTSIRAGVKQNIKQTAEYFHTEYKKYISVIEVNEAKKDIPTIENQFLNDDSSIQVLLLTNSAINKDTNSMNKLPEKGDLFINGTVWENIANKAPVVILDEPHMLTGGATKKALNKLDKSLIIRFGATYPNDDENKLSNLAYILDSISAFNQFLVKRIRVNTILTNDTAENYKLANIEKLKNKFTLSYFVNGIHHSKQIYTKRDIGAFTGIKSLKGIEAKTINKSVVNLSNGTKLELNTGFEIDEQETTIMIQNTIKTHFEKEEKLFKQGIKTLSLFFIPSIAGFRGDNPVIKNIFEKEYKTIRNQYYEKTKNQQYKEYLDKDFNDKGLFVHEGYFSGDKGSAEQQELQGVNAILHDKESLLSFTGDMGNLRFIFSVWALQEGWDNPNVMNICKLTNTTKDISRRQQVGRGLRIAVNQKGQRLTHNYLNDDEQGTLFYDINTLDMVVSHNEIDFIDNIQKEIQASSYGIMSDIITTEILKDIGLSDSSVSRFIIQLEDNDIVQNNNNELEIKSPIIEFIRNNKQNLSFLSKEELLKLEKAFKNNNKLNVDDGNKKNKKVQIISEKLDKFKELWETINRKAKIVYTNLNEQNIIDTVVNNFNNENISPITISIIKKEYDTHKDRINFILGENTGDIINYKKHFKYNDFINDIVGDTNLPLQFIIKLFNKLDIAKITQNPKLSKSKLIEIIKDTTHSNIIQSVGYDFDSEIKITDTKLHDEDGKYLTEIDSGELGKYLSDEPTMKEFLYNTVVYDSNIEKQSQTTDYSQYNDDKITVFAKLPAISIPTPYKAYNPDFAYLIENDTGKKLFLIVETKGYDSYNDIDQKEQNKIEYGKQFFKALQQQLPDIEIRFETRINTRDLKQILQDIRKSA